MRALSNGVDTDFFAPDAARRAAFRQAYGLAEGDKAVISVGHFMERKGILDFIALARAMPSVRFFWFGHTDPALVPRPIREAMAAAPANLEFPGFLSQSELRDAYCGADAFLFCSHEETEGIVVLEALACGTPTLVRDIPVYDGWLEDGVNVHKGRTNADLRIKLAALLRHRLPDVTAAGRQVALDRSLPRIGQALRQIYATLPAPQKAASAPAAAPHRPDIKKSRTIGFGIFCSGFWFGLQSVAARTAVQTGVGTGQSRLAAEVFPLAFVLAQTLLGALLGALGAGRIDFFGLFCGGKPAAPHTPK